MMRFRTLAKLATSALLAAGAISLSACSPSSAPNPNAKKVITACLAITNAQAGKILGGQLTALVLSGDNSPMKVCQYRDDKGTAFGLLQIQDAKNIKGDPVADLNADAEQVKQLFKGNLKPVVIHPADGFGPGAFYVDNTTGPDSSSVQLRANENGYKILTQVNNPKDFPTGEKQAAEMMKQALENLQNGTAMQIVQ